MFHLSRGVYGAAAIALALGAIPLAAGRDLADGAQLLLTSAASNVTRDAPAGAVNRDAKADRSARTIGAPSDTISLRLDDLPGMSVLVRLPAKSARDGSSGPSSTKSGSGRPKVACEPVVSVLTEVAKLLQPGRCVT
jgi:hypothetical protein